ncbi:MAG: ABC transporter substrate-binding protein [bacterium]|nr:ABC transporter substrate-binding protein [bacterium]
MMRKAMSVILAAAMAASLAACGGTSTTSTTAESTTAADSSVAEGTSAAESTDTAADGDKTGTFKIGAIGPITGSAAVYGTAVMDGAELAVNEINAAGGINGYQVEYQFQDDENDVEKSINAYNTLKDWGMQMLVGTTTSNPCISVAAESAVDNLFQITPSGSAVECVENPNVFRVCFSDPDQGAASAQYIGEHQLASKIAIIYDSSSVYSSGIMEKFVSEAANQNLEIVANEAFTAETNTDFTTQLQKAKDGGAELIFLPIYYTEASLILNQANQMGLDVDFFGCDGMDGILQVENFDTSLAEGLMLLTPFVADATDELTQSFVSSYEAAYGSTPIQFAADAYDAVYAIKAAAEDAGLTPDMSVSDLCEGLKTSMTKITINGLTGDNMTWNEAGEPVKAPKAMKIENGAYTAME